MNLKKERAVSVGVFVFLALIISAEAGDLSGTWIAETPLLTVTMVFIVEGTTLTGTIKTHATDEVEIQDGKVNGDKVSFYIMRPVNNKKVKVRFKGILDGQEIKFMRDDGRVTHIIAKRAHSDYSI
jgi:hypothetical protein